MVGSALAGKSQTELQTHISAAARKQLEAAIEKHLEEVERLIAVLDAADIPNALEHEYAEHDGCEPDSDYEPNFGSALASLNDQTRWAAGENFALNLDEREPED